MSDRPKSTPTPPDPALDRLADLADIPADGPEAEAVAIRNTYRVRLTEAGARQLEQLADQLEDAARVEHSVPSYEKLFSAAGEDLVAIGALLRFYADHCGDGVRRDQVRLSAVVLDVADEVERLGTRLMDAVAAATTDSST